VWLSLTVDGEVFDEADRPALQPLTDWHIVASAPLVVENTLPISGSFMVWEQPEVRSFTYRTLCSRSHLHNPQLGVQLVQSVQCWNCCNVRLRHKPQGTQQPRKRHTSACKAAFSARL